MNILYYYNNFRKIGGMEKILIEKINELSKNNELEILLVTNEEILNNDFYKINLKVKIINLNLKINQNQILKVMESYRKIKKIINIEKPSIIITLTSLESMICNFFKNKSRLIREFHFSKNFRKLDQENNGLIKKIKIAFINYFDYFFIKNVDRFVVLTAEDSEDWNLKNSCIIPNFKTLEIEKSSSLDGKKAIAVGRLETQKGFDTLIEIWANSVTKDWKLEIWGEGSQREILQNKISELGQTEKIYLKGNTNNIIEKYLESSIYLMTSRHEGLPLVLIEAMELGLPIISFDCKCGPRDIIKHKENGYLIKNRNNQEYQRYLASLIENLELRKELGKNSKNMSKNYSKKVIVEQWIKLFQEVIKIER